MPRLQAFGTASGRHLTPTSLLRLPRTGNPHHRHARPRYFTQRLSLLLISRTASRPQIPFLNPSLSRLSNPTSLATRNLSDDRRARLKALIRWNLRLQFYVWSAFLLGLIAYNGLEQTRYERKYPTPREWGFWSRWHLRNGNIKENEDRAKLNGVTVDWQKVGVSYMNLLENLEDQNKEGTNLVRRQWDGADGINGGGDILIDGLGTIGFDLTAKSEEWRRGYYQCLMGAGRAAEHLEGMAKPKGKPLVKSYIIPWDSVLGPNNPRPKKLPWDRKGEYEKIHRVEDMEDAYETPEYFYMRVLTTNGFTTKQRLDAALAYADWLDFKGMTDTAGSVYDWALDIAAGGLPLGAGHVVDIKTGIINQGHEQHTTENLLTATTAMGVHYAKLGNVKQALPIFLSVLRARRSLSATPLEIEAGMEEQEKQQNPFTSYLSAFKDMIVDAPYPKPPSSGDERPYHTMKEACEEVGLMTYIGEILFATSDKEREKGLSWTRDSVGAAEAVLWVMDEKRQRDEKARAKCQECLETGLDNWKKMARQMVVAAQKKEKEAQKAGGWLGLGIGRASAIQTARRDVDRWQEEEDQIGLMKEKTASLLEPSRPLFKTDASVL